jgi:hypothetical protein
MKRVEDWKSRLIDLSRRNNLLYVKKNKRGNLTITQPDQQAVFNALVLKKRHLEFWAPPEEDEAPEKPAKSDNAKGNSKAKTSKIAKTSRANAKAVVQNDVSENPAQTKEIKKRPTANQLVCGTLSGSDLERNLKGLQWRSLLDYRERGVRILHAAFGTLNWIDTETKERVQSPLILVPLELTRESIRQP